MQIDEFRSTLGQESPPPCAPALVALWHDARGDWNAALQVAQDLEGADAAWVHAYLHRKEGDAANAAYWYDRAKQPTAQGSLDEEWAQIAGALLARDATR